MNIVKVKFIISFFLWILRLLHQGYVPSGQTLQMYTKKIKQGCLPKSRRKKRPNIFESALQQTSMDKMASKSTRTHHLMLLLFKKNNLHKINKWHCWAFMGPILYEESRVNGNKKNTPVLDAYWSPTLDHIFIQSGPASPTSPSLPGLPAHTCVGILPSWEPMWQYPVT